MKRFALIPVFLALIAMVVPGTAQGVKVPTKTVKSVWRPVKGHPEGGHFVHFPHRSKFKSPSIKGANGVRTVDPSQLPAGPATLDWAKQISFPMDLNDTYGDCLVEGTEVQASRPHAGYRAPYSGPVITLRFASGKELTCTPNHAVLTPSGFIAARLLQEGNYAVSGSFPEGLDRSIDFDFNKPPTRIEQVVDSLPGRRGSMMSRADHFHGDGRFINGNIDVVSTAGFLRSEFNSPERQPHTEKQIVAAGELQGSLHGQGSALQGHQISRTASLGDIGSSGLSLPFFFGHSFVSDGRSLAHGSRLDSVLDQEANEPVVVNSNITGNPQSRLPVLVSAKSVGKSKATLGVLSRVAEIDRLSLRSKCYAGSNKSSTNSDPASVELGFELAKRFPGLISSDRIVKVERKTWTGHVYDLSTESNWYVANGIIVHNCYYAAISHAMNTYTGNTGTSVTFSTSAIKTRYFTLSGGDNGLGDQDVQGEMMSTSRPYQGYVADIQGTSIIDFAYINPNDSASVQKSMNMFGPVYFTFAVPDNWINNSNTGTTWDAPAQPDQNNGHAVILNGYNGNKYTLQTWGSYVYITQAGIADCDPSAWVALSAKWFDAKGYAPNGLHVTDVAKYWTASTGKAVPASFISQFPPAVNSSPPAITSPLTASGTVNQPFSYQITATNSPTSYAVTGGFSVSATGLVSGTPIQAGTFNVQVSATNASGTGNAIVVVSVGGGVNPPPPPPPPPGSIVLSLTPDQVQSILSQAGAIQLTPEQIQAIQIMQSIKLPDHHNRAPAPKKTSSVDRSLDRNVAWAAGYLYEGEQRLAKQNRKQPNPPPVAAMADPYWIAGYKFAEGTDLSMPPGPVVDKPASRTNFNSEEDRQVVRRILLASMPGGNREDRAARFDANYPPVPSNNRLAEARRD